MAVVDRTPDEQPVPRSMRVNDVDLCIFEWPGDGPPLLFAHATGFHARCWDQVIRRLPGRRAIAVDMRGHGRSEKPAQPYEWRRFGEDALAIARELDLHGALGVGHSMGGHSVTYAAARDPDRFSALLLVDPVIGPREGYRARAGSPDRRETSFVAKRRNEWASAEEMVQRFRDRPPFNRWNAAVLRDYCEHGLLPAPAGDGFVLACPPTVEAAIYAMSTSTDVYDDVERLDLPVRVLRAAPASPGERAMSFSRSPTAPDLARHFPRGEDVLLPDATHFIPMESPELVAAHVRQLQDAS